MRLVMMGTGTFAEPTFEALLRCGHPVVGLVTQPDRPRGHERGSTRQTGKSMSAIAQENAVPVLQPESVNSPEGVAGLKTLHAELLVVAAFGQILSREVLTVSAHGGINVHGSLLPRYRGAAPVAWAIFHGEKQTGVSIIKMSTALDAGDILAREAIDIGPEETAGEVEAQLAVLGARLTVQVIEQIAAGTVRGIPQDRSLVTKAPKLTKEHGLIDWTRPAETVCNHVRAMQPWPTAYTFRHRAGHPPARVIVCRAVSFPHSSAAPGAAVPLKDDPSRLIVGAGNGGCVEILELQPAGKRRMPAADYLRGHPVLLGDRFGPEAGLQPGFPKTHEIR